MEWFTQRTPIAGIQISNWMVVLGAIIVILVIYTFVHWGSLATDAKPVASF